MNQLETTEQFDQLLQDEEYFVVYKHSPTCSVSVHALDEVEAVTKTFQPHIWQISVIIQRPLAQHIEKVTGVRHESPQIVIIKNSIIVAHASHFSITTTWIEEQLAMHIGNT